MSVSSSASSSRRSSSSGPADASSSTSPSSSGSSAITVTSALGATAQQQQRSPSPQQQQQIQQQQQQQHSSAPRTRHHSRSVSQEASRFPTVTSFNLSPPRRSSNGGHGSHSLKMTINQVMLPTVPAAPSSSASTTPSSSNNSSKNTSPDRDDDQSEGSASPVSSSAVSSTEGSPVTLRISSSALPGDDESRLKALLEAQASRRPRLMRLTPAYASLPGRMPQAASVTSNSAERGALPFPKQDLTKPFHHTSGSDVVDQIRGQPRTPPLEPPSDGLLLDMSNLPAPTIGDANAAQSTSTLSSEVRTKSGRLIKPALRNSSFVGSTSGCMAGMNRANSMTATTANTPSLMRAKSTPNTPLLPKVVQFDSHLEHIKVFKFKQKPTAISRTGSPEQTETETEEERELFPFVNYGRKGPSSPGSTPNASTPVISSTPGQAPVEEQLVLRLPNFPSSARLSVDKDVFLERIYLAEDLRSVKGTVRVRNISFEKWVAVRFTLDNWVTVNEVSAEYAESLADGSADRFTFSIKLNELLDWPRGAGQHETKTMFLCLRYTTSNGQHWDNNDGLNYQLDFRKRQLPSTPMPTPNPSRPSTRAQTISGPLSSQQARVIDMVRRHGVQAGMGGGFVEDLRRELDKLKSDEEDADRMPIITKKMAAAATGAGASAGGPLAVLRQKRSTASPPASPGPRMDASPMWSARYDWNESLRNSAPSSSRARPAIYDYFNSRPPPPASAMGDSEAPALFVSAASPPSQASSAISTPLGNAFGQTRAGMLSPAVGDVFAHHQPTAALPYMSSPLASSVETSENNSAANSPDRMFAASLGMAAAAAGRDGKLSPGNGNSPTQRLAAANRFPQRQANVSPLASGQTSLENSDWEEEEQTDGKRHTTAAALASRIVTVPRSSIKGRAVQKKDDGLVLENYDSPLARTAPLSQPVGRTSATSTEPYLFSPSNSVSSMESEVSDLVTPEDAPPQAVTVSYRRDGGGSGDGSSRSGSASASGEDSPAAISTPRLLSQRRWSPPGSTDKLLPASAADLSELIQKYCWSNESVPGLGLGLGSGSTSRSTVSGSGISNADGIRVGSNGRSRDDSPSGLSAVGGKAAIVPGCNVAGLPSPLTQSGTATPTGEF